MYARLAAITIPSGTQRRALVEIQKLSNSSEADAPHALSERVSRRSASNAKTASRSKNERALSCQVSALNSV